MGITSLLLDRDGTLIREFRQALSSTKQVQVRRAVAHALAGLPQRMLCVTNQSAIGRGQLSVELTAAVNAHVAERYRRLGVAIEAFLVCPHAPWDGCACRKPRPGLLRRAAEEYGVELPGALVIGNRLSDAEAAAAAGCAGTILLDNPRLRAELQAARLPLDASVVRVTDLATVLRDGLAAHGTRGRRQRYSSRRPSERKARSVTNSR